MTAERGGMFGVRMLSNVSEHYSGNAPQGTVTHAQSL